MMTVMAGAFLIVVGVVGRLPWLEQAPSARCLGIDWLWISSVFRSERRSGNRGKQQPTQEPLKVFLLAGQSNMVGMGSLKHLDLLVQQEQENEYRQTLWNGTAYKVRDDVYMIYESHYGPLTVGRQYAGKDSFGPELLLGWTITTKTTTTTTTTMVRRHSYCSKRLGAVATWRLIFDRRRRERGRTDNTPRITGGNIGP